MSEQPNILMIMADQLTAKVLRAYGADRAAKTPNLDRLSVEGHVMENAYCPFPITGDTPIPSLEALFEEAFAYGMHIVNGEMRRARRP